jgi:ribosomal protein S18 acetylase RimI-like enzyme
MAEEIILKRAGVEDIDKILEVEKSVIGTKIYSGLTGSDDTKKEITENIFYLIIKNGKVVGDVAYQMKDKNHAYISGLVVAKEFQGQGIAKQAMKIILEKLRDIKIIDLVTHPENIKAIGLYRSLGFKQVGEQMENYFDDGEPRIRMILEK